MMLRSVWESFVNLIFPPLCAGCKRCVNHHHEYLCIDCQNALPRTPKYEPDNAIEKRLWGKFKFERCWSFLYFEKGNLTQTLLHELKYKSHPQLGNFLGSLAATELLDSASFSDFDILVPVPLHPSKLKKRGYNQSAQIAQGIAIITQMPVDETSLVRQVANDTQTRKSVYQRHENTKGIFRLENEQAFEHKHILLVDDVLTTGATLDACVAELAHIEGVRISVFCIAVAR